ncbi:MAG: acyl-CoA dehydrogenase, partial [Nonomuraea sp.]|nr:acyl-CoA dehydrogenase [Nonomuraea sp.]
MERSLSLRDEARDWLAANLPPELKGLGGPGREHEGFEERRAWERTLGAAGWTCLGWPREYGGRAAPLADQVAFHEEYAAADAPARVGLIGEGLIGPTILEYGTPAQQARFLPPIQRGEELWCQGYSEPDAGSDLAGVRTHAELVGDEWVITGQKVWTSFAHVADWCFALCRTESGSSRHRGLSYLLVPMRQPGVEVRPIVQLTGT